MGEDGKKEEGGRGVGGDVGRRVWKGVGRGGDGDAGGLLLGKEICLRKGRGAGNRV